MQCVETMCKSLLYAGSMTASLCITKYKALFQEPVMVFIYCMCMNHKYVTNLRFLKQTLQPNGLEYITKKHVSVKVAILSDRLVQLFGG